MYFRLRAVIIEGEGCRSPFQRGRVVSVSLSITTVFPCFSRCHRSFFQLRQSVVFGQSKPVTDRIEQVSTAIFFEELVRFACNQEFFFEFLLTDDAVRHVFAEAQGCVEKRILSPALLDTREIEILFRANIGRWPHNVGAQDLLNPQCEPPQAHFYTRVFLHERRE